MYPATILRLESWPQVNLVPISRACGMSTSIETSTKLTKQFSYAIHCHVISCTASTMNFASTSHLFLPPKMSQATNAPPNSHAFQRNTGCFPYGVTLLSSYSSNKFVNKSCELDLLLDWQELCLTYRDSSCLADDVYHTHVESWQTDCIGARAQVSGKPAHGSCKRSVTSDVVRSFQVSGISHVYVRLICGVTYRLLTWMCGAAAQMSTGRYRTDCTATLVRFVFRPLNIIYFNLTMRRLTVLVHYHSFRPGLVV